MRGESLTQTLQFVKSGAAELGFVAWSQVIHEPEHTYWLVPAEYHEPLAQDAVLLLPGRDHPAARAYLDFLRGDVARRLIESFGYGTR